MYPSYHSAGLMNGQQKLQSDETTLAEILRNAGWRTAAIVSNAILNRTIGLDQGFESYNDRLPHRESVRRKRERRASSAVDETLAKLDEFGDQRFFLWLHLQDPHGSYSPPATAPGLSRPEDEPPVGPMLPIGEDNSGFRAIPSYQAYEDERAFGDYRDRYDAEIRYLDSELSRLFAYLDAHKLLRHTLVVVTADHGEAMGENDFYFAHGHSVGLEQVLVPLFFVGDGVLSDQSVTTPVSNMSIFATILNYLDQPIPDDIQSQSLLATLSDGGDVAPGPFFTESFTQRGIVDAGYYLHDDRRPASDERFWRSSPISGGYITPLGPQIRRLGSSTGADSSLPPSDLERRLQVFSRSAEDALASFLTRAERPKASAELIKELRALGYTR
jgi:arylsulfatase A-like enzyme